MAGMIGVAVNTATVLIGSLLGLLLKKGIAEKYKTILMKGIGLCTIYIGISGTLQGENTIVLIISIVLGALLGSWVDIDRRFNRFSEKIEKKLKKSEVNAGTFANGFVTACLVFCIGSMTIVGSLEAGLNGDNQMIFIKSVLDLISSFVLASTLGVGVCASAVFVFVFQGAIVLLSSAVAPFLSDSVINEMVSVGSLLILALGLNLAEIGKFKVMNYLPAILFPVLLVPLYELIAAAIGA
ncbi:MAG: DUF554 domain-containing protein [Clostridiales bacterium]|nr:DUF554 domain-containing protein [Clostridiales bacterium]